MLGLTEYAAKGNSPELKAKGDVRRLDLEKNAEMDEAHALLELTKTKAHVDRCAQTDMIATSDVEKETVSEAVDTDTEKILFIEDKLLE